MNTKTMIEQITKIAPKYRPDSDDLSWFENELEKVAAKSLPRLIKKRFAQSFGASTTTRAPTTAALAPKQMHSADAKS